MFKFYVNEIFKVNIKLKMLIQNIQWTLDQIPRTKEQTSLILDYSDMYCLWIVKRHLLFFRLNLFKIA